MARINEILIPDFSLEERWAIADKEFPIPIVDAQEVRKLVEHILEEHSEWVFGLYALQSRIKARDEEESTQLELPGMAPITPIKKTSQQPLPDHQLKAISTAVDAVSLPMRRLVDLLMYPHLHSVEAARGDEVKLLLKRHELYYKLTAERRREDFNDYSLPNAHPTGRFCYMWDESLSTLRPIEITSKQKDELTRIIGPIQPVWLVHGMGDKFRKEEYWNTGWTDVLLLQLPNQALVILNVALQDEKVHKMGAIYAQLEGSKTPALDPSLATTYEGNDTKALDLRSNEALQENGWRNLPFVKIFFGRGRQKNLKK